MWKKNYKLELNKLNEDKEKEKNNYEQSIETLNEEKIKYEQSIKELNEQKENKN